MRSGRAGLVVGSDGWSNAWISDWPRILRWLPGKRRSKVGRFRQENRGGAKSGASRRKLSRLLRSSVCQASGRAAIAAP